MNLTTYNFLAIDIEGSELLALQGARRCSGTVGSMAYESTPQAGRRTCAAATSPTSRSASSHGRSSLNADVEYCAVHALPTAPW